MNYFNSFITLLSCFKGANLLKVMVNCHEICTDELILDSSRNLQLWDVCVTGQRIKTFLLLFQYTPNTFTPNVRLI